MAEDVRRLTAISDDAESILKNAEGATMLLANVERWRDAEQTFIFLDAATPVMSSALTGDVVPKNGE